MDETYIKVHGQWVYLYHAVDKACQTVDFFLSRDRDVHAAKSFLRSAMKNTRVPTKITLDAYAASHRGSARDEGRRRASVPRQDSIQPVLEQAGGAGPSESKATNPADAGIQAIRQCAGNDRRIELAEKIKKGQFKTGKLGRCNATMTELWNAALAA